MIGLASLLGAALAAGPALAVTASSPTGHLNVRSGPGFQYQVVSQIPANTPAQITGCVSDYSWCAVALPGGVTGWASAPYLVTSAAGTPKNLQVVGAQLGIPVVTPANTGAPVVATPPVGAMVPVAPTVGVVQPVAPPPTVLSYMMQQAIQPVLVNGEVMVGAVLPPGRARLSHSAIALPLFLRQRATSSGRADCATDRLRREVDALVRIYLAPDRAARS
jgi:uncharacterized protein YraI